VRKIVEETIVIQKDLAQTGDKLSKPSFSPVSKPKTSEKID
jgi:hypothetical protein